MPTKLEWAVSEKIDAVAVKVPVSSAGLSPPTVIVSTWFVSTALVAVGGEEVATLSEFYHAVWALGQPGVTVPLTLAREGDVFEVEVKSKDRADFLKLPKMH